MFVHFKYNTACTNVVASFIAIWRGLLNMSQILNDTEYEHISLVAGWFFTFYVYAQEIRQPITDMITIM